MWKRYLFGNFQLHQAHVQGVEEDPMIQPTRRRRRCASKLREGRPAAARLRCSRRRGAARPHRPALRRCDVRQLLRRSRDPRASRQSRRRIRHTRSADRGGDGRLRDRGWMTSGADAVLVVGDVNSTVACTLVAAKAGDPSGTRRGRAALVRPNHARGDQPSRRRRSGDMAVHTERRRRRQSARRRRRPERIFRVGNVMVDSLLTHIDAARARPVRARARPADSVRTGHAAPPGLGRQPCANGGDDADPRSNRRGPSARLSCPPADTVDARPSRHRRRSREGPRHRTAGLPGFPRARGGGIARAHRLRWGPGGDAQCSACRA